MNTNESNEEKEISPFEIKEREKRRCWNDLLDVGAKLLFSFLIDCSWLRKFGGGGDGGVICISVSQISRFLRVGPRSVSRWSKSLAERGYLWVTRRPLPNCKPINVYHLNCLCPADPDARQISFDDAGIWGVNNHEEHSEGTTANLAVEAEEEGELSENEETGQNGTPKVPERPLPHANLAATSSHNGHGQVPKRPLAGAKLASGSSHNGHGQVPKRPRAGAKLATGRCHNGHGQVPKGDVIRRFQNGRNGVSIEGGGAPPRKIDKKEAFKLPQFAPIPKDIFPSKLKPMIAECEAAIKRAENNPAFKTTVPTQGPDLGKMLSEAERLEKLGGEKNTMEAKSIRDRAETLAAIQGNKPKERLVLSEEGKAVIGLYRARIQQIRTHMAGIEVPA